MDDTVQKSDVSGVEGDVANETFDDAMQAASVPDTQGLRLARLAGVHLLVLLLALSGFAAADSWSVVTGLGIASLLSFVTGALAGIVVANLVHEWFHLAGARFTGGVFDIPARLSLFVYNWDFSKNSSSQFLTMSVAGNIGGVLAALLLWEAIPADNLGRAALRGGVLGSVIFAALIEWPIISRVRGGADPLTELATIPARLTRNFIIALLSGLLLTLFFAP